MILTDNINLLKERFPNTWEQIKEHEKNMDNEIFVFEDTKDGNKTLFVEKGEKKNYLHSKYNPIREANALIEEIEDINEETTIIFYGVGLGYHIDLLLEKYPNISCYIYEPIPELLYKYLSHKSIKKLSSLKLRNVVTGGSVDDIRQILNQAIDKAKDNVVHIPLKSHTSLFPNLYVEFLKLFKETMVDNRRSIAAELKFQKRWTVNSMKNFGYVLNSPNILIEKKGKFKGKPAIIVAAGPSLNEEIENIRYIKDNGLAYIFSVGSAINSLINNDIYPHAATTYDPYIYNKNVFKKAKELKIDEIPIIFGSSVGYETLPGYLGKMYHMITSQDTIAGYFLKNRDKSNIDIVFDAPTIAVVTMQLLYEMGFDTIILAGQNLGYFGRERHSKGTQNYRLLTDKEIKNSLKIKDVYGNEILTAEGFNSMREQMEHYIKIFPGLKVINTTKGGAHIEGTKFIEFSTVIESILTEPVVEERWLEGNKTKYDGKYLEMQKNKIDIAYKKAKEINKNYKLILNKIEKSINHRNFSQAENMYVKLDKELRKIENNDFYKVFILPMNRVEYKALANSIDNINEINDPKEKGETIVNSFRKFLKTCQKDIEEIEPIYEELKENIDKYIYKENEV